MKSVLARTTEPSTRAAERHLQMFRAYVLAGEHGARQVAEANHVSPDEFHALIEGDQELGGALVPTDGEYGQLMRDAEARSVFLRLALVLPTSLPALPIPVLKERSSGEANYPSGFVGQFVQSPKSTGGTAPATQDQPTFEGHRIPTHPWAPDAIEIARNLLDDTGPVLERFLNRTMAATFSVDLDKSCAVGIGVNEPLGIVTDHADFALPIINSGNANIATYDGLTNLVADLPDHYRQNATWVMKSLTWAAILKLKDGNGRPHFSPDTERLFGRPIAFVEFMPSVAANAFPIALVDLNFYVVAMRSDFRVQRMVERFAPNIALQPWGRVGGQMIRPNAGRRLKIAA